MCGKEGNVVNTVVQKQDREQWIDFMKAIAILAVLINHTAGLCYTNPYIGIGSFFSVTLFIILSGITSYSSFERHKDIPYKKDLDRKLKGILIPYGISTACCVVLHLKYFDLLTFITYFLYFNGSPPFYFVLFYIQLMLISRPLSLFVNTVYESKRPIYQKVLIHIAVGILLLYATHIFINYTSTHNINGGAKYLFGGTYLFIYYIGIILGSCKKILYPSLTKSSSYIYIYICGIIIFPILSVATFMEMITKGPFFGSVAYFGGTYNPPETRLIVYTLMVFGGLLCLNWIIDKISFKPFTLIRNAIAWLGRYSLYIFLFHMTIIVLLNNTSYAHKDCRLNKSPSQRAANEARMHCAGV